MLTYQQFYNVKNQQIKQYQIPYISYCKWHIRVVDHSIVILVHYSLYLIRSKNVKTCGKVCLTQDVYCSSLQLLFQTLLDLKHIQPFTRSVHYCPILNWKTDKFSINPNIKFQTIKGREPIWIKEEQIFVYNELITM